MATSNHYRSPRRSLRIRSPRLRRIVNKPEPRRCHHGFLGWARIEPSVSAQSVVNGSSPALPRFPDFRVSRFLDLPNVFATLRETMSVIGFGTFNPVSREGARPQRRHCHTDYFRSLRRVWALLPHQATMTRTPPTYTIHAAAAMAPIFVTLITDMSPWVAGVTIK